MCYDLPLGTNVNVDPPLPQVDEPPVTLWSALVQMEPGETSLEA